MEVRQRRAGRGRAVVGAVVQGVSIAARQTREESGSRRVGKGVVAMVSLGNALESGLRNGLWNLLARRRVAAQFSWPSCSSLMELHRSRVTA